jgi:hypothetical protein
MWYQNLALTSCFKDFTTVGAELFSCVFHCPKQEDNSKKAKSDSCFERDHLDFEG